MAEMILACPFCDEPLPANHPRFYDDRCGDILLASMTPERRAGFDRMNPYTLGLRQEMTAAEVAAFNALRSATRGFTQTLELTDPGNPANPDDRNAHSIALALPGEPLSTEEAIEAAVTAAIHAQRIVFEREAFANATAEYERRKTIAAEADQREKDLIELAAIPSYNVPVDAVLAAKRANRAAQKELETPISELEKAEMERLWPYDERNTIMRLKREMSTLSMYMAIKFPTTTWEFYEPKAMTVEKETERKKLILESLGSTKSVNKVRVQTAEAAPVQVPTAAPEAPATTEATVRPDPVAAMEAELRKASGIA